MRPSIHDWLSRAKASRDPAEAQRCLDAAIDGAEACYQWRTLLDAAAELTAAELISAARLAELAERTLAAAKSECEVWGFRDVARVRVTHLRDRAGARAALEACVAASLAPRRAPWGGDDTVTTRGYEWVLLAKGFVETLGDPAGARRCLEAGRDQARGRDDADDLTAVACGWATLLDREAGVALLREAEALADNGSARPWTLANAWRSVDDGGSAARVLDRAIDLAATTGDAKTIAQAWISHARPDDAARALAKVRELAVSADDWLAVAELTHTLGLGEGALRGSLGRAEPLATEPRTRAQIAAAYRRWLGDETASARLGPVGVEPSQLRRPVAPLSGWDGSASALFDRLRDQIRDEELQSIARADYGMDAEQHLLALREICESGLVPRTLEWEPHEVLALTRWSSGETVNHVERALCALLLCLAPSSMDEFGTNGVILAESCLALGAEATRLGARFFAWFAGTTEIDDDDDDDLDDDDDELELDDDDLDDDRPLALLLLFVLRLSVDPADPRLERLAARILSETSARERDAIAASMAESMRAQLWSDLLESALQPTHPPSARLLEAFRRATSRPDG